MSTLTAEPQTSAMTRLTEAQIKEYYVEGYTLVRGLVPKGSIDKLMATAPNAGVSANREWNARSWEPKEPMLGGANGAAQVHRLFIEPSVIQACEDIFGAPARCYWGMLALVAPHGGRGLKWHQDNQYTHIFGGALNIFIAVSRITPEMANLWVAPKSHLLGTVPSKDQVGHREVVNAPENGILLPTLEPGDACIFTRDTIHRSLTNETDQVRYAYAAQYSSNNSRYSKDGSIPGNKPLAWDLRKLWVSEGLVD